MSRRQWYYVYVLWDSEDKPLYVGRSGNVKQRIKLHYSHARGNAVKAEWFSRVRRVSMNGPFSYDMSHRIERGQVERLQPEANIQLRGWA